MQISKVREITLLHVFLVVIIHFIHLLAGEETSISLSNNREQSILYHCIVNNGSFHHLIGSCNFLGVVGVNKLRTSSSVPNRYGGGSSKYISALYNDILENFALCVPFSLNIISSLTHNNVSSYKDHSAVRQFGVWWFDVISSMLLNLREFG